MSSFLYRIGRASYRARGRVVAAWLLIVVLLGGLSLTIGGAFDDSFTIPNARPGTYTLYAYTDGILGDPQLIRYSIATMATALFLAGGIVIASGLRAVGKSVSTGHLSVE